ALLSGNQRMVSEIFRRDFTTLSKGSIADLVVIDYQSPTPMTVDNLCGHFLFGMQSSMIESVMSNGRWIVKDRELLGVDTASIFEKASKVGKKLWNRMQKM
ncbi:MAG TPA: chlorohydrolase, partial [Bacteroidota bacterium]|nr:chlorohydrolase [Bacteroidota bacterium]